MDTLYRLLGRQTGEEKQYIAALQEVLTEFTQWGIAFTEAMKSDNKTGKDYAAWGCSKAFERFKRLPFTKRMPLTLWRMTSGLCDAMLVVVWSIEVIQGLRTEQEAIDGLIVASKAGDPSDPVLLNDRVIDALRQDGFGLGSVAVGIDTIKSIADELTKVYPQCRDVSPKSSNNSWIIWGLAILSVVIITALEVAGVMRPIAPTATATPVPVSMTLEEYHDWCIKVAHQTGVYLDAVIALGVPTDESARTTYKNTTNAGAAQAMQFFKEAQMITPPAGFAIHHVYFTSGLGHYSRVRLDTSSAAELQKALAERNAGNADFRLATDELDRIKASMK